ncbi:DUF3501 family protein [Nitrospira sp. Kam-Ns4a]
MKPLTQDDLLPYAEYERVRDGFRREIIALKRRRRLAIGDRVTLVFENRATVRFQVLEMIRTERIFDPAKVQEELDVYNALLPGAGELSATLFIEITEQARIKEELDAFQGIDQTGTVALRAGPETVFAEFEGGRSKEDKLSAVHFVRFRPSETFVKALATRESPVVALVQHPRYQAESPVPDAIRGQWLADLGQPVPGWAQ